MRLATAVFLLALVGSATSGAMAQDAEPMSDAGPRFSLRAQGDGFVRLDRETGAMSFCRVDGGNLVCRLGADEREAYQEALDKLEARVAALEEKAETAAPPAPPKPVEPVPPSAGPVAPEAKPTPEQELDNAMALAERAMRRFFDVVKNLREEFETQSQ